MRPSIVATLSNFKTLKSSLKKAAHLGADIVELRIDAFPANKREELLNILPTLVKGSPFQWIATIRRSQEQGPKKSPNYLSDQNRAKIFESVLPFVDFIDIEISAEKINRLLIQKAHKLKKRVILSYHDFKSIPSEERLKNLLRQFLRLKGDIFKVAATPKDEEELLIFLTFAAHHPEIQKAFIAMGEVGKISRTQAELFGSCLTYGYVDRSFAPGQVSIVELTKKR